MSRITNCLLQIPFSAPHIPFEKAASYTYRIHEFPKGEDREHLDTFLAERMDTILNTFVVNDRISNISAFNDEIIKTLQDLSYKIPHEDKQIHFSKPHSDYMVCKEKSTRYKAIFNSLAYLESSLSKPNPVAPAHLCRKFKDWRAALDPEMTLDLANVRLLKSHFKKLEARAAAGLKEFFSLMPYLS